MKSKHDYYNGIIPNSELNNFIDPVTMTIPVPLMDFPSISGNKYEEFYKRYKSLFETILSNFPTLNSKIDKRVIDIIGCISYTPHKDGYDFRFNPIDIYNNILKYMGYDESIPFINLDSDNGMDIFKEYVNKIVNKLKVDYPFDERNTILDELNDNKDLVCKLYDYPVKEDLKNNGYILAKDALLYLAFSSLLKYNTTHERVYKILPYEYYNYVSHMNNSYFPHKISVGFSGKLWFDDFRGLYEESIGKEFIPLFNECSLENNELICGWEILSSGKAKTVIKNFDNAIRRASGVNAVRNLKLYELKSNFFQRSGYKTIIKGKFGLNGYVGFVYPNDYLIYDKFYNTDDLPDDKKTILSHPEAIYSIPSDRIEVTAYDKQTLKKIKEQDERIIKNNHTINGSFVDKLDRIAHGPNVSTMSFEEVVERRDNKILFLKK